jgi:transposase
LIVSARQVSVYACAEPIDMRKSFDTLAALVKETLEQDLLSGSLFLFVSRNRKRAKVLYFDGTGLCLFAKRLEKGTFAAVCDRERSRSVKLTLSGEPVDLKVYESSDRDPPIAAVTGTASEPNVRVQMNRLLTEYPTDLFSFRASWRVRGTRDGRSTSYRVAVSVRSPLARHVPWFDRDVDVTWDLGDSSHYSPEGKDQHPNVELLVSDLQVLIELGAGSIWAAGPERVMNPLQLYAVYHRDSNDYRNDGLPVPLSKWPIDTEDIEVADEYARKDGGSQRLFASKAGPIIYSPLLERGTLNMFYTQLEEVLKAGMSADMRRTGAASYRAYNCSENQESWIVVERRSDGTEILRVDSIRQDADILTIAYEIIEPGIDDQIVRTLVPLAVLKGLYGDAHRSSVKQLRHQNLATGTDDLVPYMG